jgi:enoyl-CoA hydratase
MKYVRSEQCGEVATIFLENPDGGFMTGDMVTELDRAVSAMESEGKVRSVIITGGAEGTFVTHYTLEDAEQLGDMPGWFRRSLLKPVVSVLLKAHTAASAIPSVRSSIDALASHTDLKGLTEVNRIHRLLARMQTMNMVFIAAINGNAMGGGCELALACDYRLMAKGDYALGLPEVIAGVFPGAGGSQRMARMLGPHKALELILDGTMLDADAAERIGMVNRAVPGDALLSEATKLATRLAKRPPLSVGAVKRAIFFGIDLPMSDALEIEKSSFVETGFSDDAVVAGRHYFDNYRSGKSPRQIFDGYRDGTAVTFSGR